jgi:FAD/FMN-containing dehydrogenase
MTPADPQLPGDVWGQVLGWAATMLMSAYLAWKAKGRKDLRAPYSPEKGAQPRIITRDEWHGVVDIQNAWPRLRDRVKDLEDKVDDMESVKRLLRWLVNQELRRQEREGRIVEPPADNRVSGETQKAVSGWTTDTLKEYIERRVAELERADQSIKAINDERDRLYKERDEARRTAVDAALAAAKAAVDAALIAVKEQTKASFEASEKAIVKAEEAQKAYNASHNDLARKMDEQNKATMPRTESEARFRTLEEKINDLRESRSGDIGGAHGRGAMKDESRANLGTLVALIGAALALGALVARMLH